MDGALGGNMSYGIYLVDEKLKEVIYYGDNKSIRLDKPKAIINFLLSRDGNPIKVLNENEAEQLIDSLDLRLLNGY